MATEKTFEEKLKESMAASGKGPEGGKQSATDALAQLEKAKAEALTSDNRPSNLVIESKSEIPDWPRADSKVKTIELQLQNAQGQKGMNPYLWKKNNKWAKVIEGIKERNVAAYAVLQEIPDTINCSCKDGGAMILEESDFKSKK